MSRTDGRSYPLISLFKSKRNQRGLFAVRHAGTYLLDHCIYWSRKDAALHVLVQAPRASSDLLRAVVAARAQAVQHPCWRYLHPVRKALSPSSAARCSTETLNVFALALVFPVCCPGHLLVQGLAGYNVSRKSFNFPSKLSLSKLFRYLRSSERNKCTDISNNEVFRYQK
jgi:hypothetical protein